MGVSEVTAIISLVISFCVAIFVYLERRYREKRSMCVQVWNFWNTVHVREARSKAFDHLISLDYTKSIDLRELIEKDPELRYAYSTVIHFFKEFNILLEENVLDRRLASRLFSETVNDRFSYLNNKSLILWGHGDQKYSHEEIPKHLPDLLSKWRNKK